MVFGKAAGFARQPRPRRRCDGSNGFRLRRAAMRGDDAGYSVSIGGRRQRRRLRRPDRRRAIDADGGRHSAGESYVVFGKATGFGATLDLVDAATAPTASGSTGVDGGRPVGLSVAAAGDVNGDGFDDLIVGARRRRPAATMPAKLRGVRRRLHRRGDPPRHVGADTLTGTPPPTCSSAARQRHARPATAAPTCSTAARATTS